MDTILELPLYHEPFVAYIPDSNPLKSLDHIEIDDLNSTDILILEDGHCFRDHVLNLCQVNSLSSNRFDLKSGSFETLIKLADEGLGMTLLPYLNADSMTTEKKNLNFPDPAPTREVNLIHSKSKLKLPVLNVLKSTISSIIRAAINFGDIKVISPQKFNHVI